MPIDLPTSISLLVGVFVIFGFGLSAYYHKKQKDSNEAGVMLQISNEVSIREAKGAEIKDIGELSMWVADYGSYMDLIAHLLIEKKMHKKAGDFFEPYLLDAYHSASFMDTKTRDKIFLKNLGDLKKWYEQKPRIFTMMSSAEAMSSKLQTL